VSYDVSNNIIKTDFANRYRGQVFKPLPLVQPNPPWSKKELGLVGPDGRTKTSPVLLMLSRGKAPGPDGMLDIHLHDHDQIRDEVFEYVKDLFNGRH
jgi:hypothetical protein